MGKYPAHTTKAHLVLNMSFGVGSFFNLAILWGQLYNGRRIGMCMALGASANSHATPTSFLTPVSL